MLSNCGLAFPCCTQGGFELYITSVGVAVARRPILGLPGLNRLWFGFPMFHAGRVSANNNHFNNNQFNKNHFNNNHFNTDLLTNTESEFDEYELVSRSLFGWKFVDLAALLS